MVYCVDGPPADSSIQLTEEHLLFRVGDRFRILLPAYFTSTVAECSASVANAVIPSLLDCTGPGGAPGSRVGLEVARASSMWHSATVPLDVCSPENGVPRLFSVACFEPTNDLIMSVGSSRLTSCVSSGNRGEFCFALGDYLGQL